VLFKIYSGLADSCGVPQLAKKLNKVGFAMLKTQIVFIICFNFLNAGIITPSAYTIKKTESLEITQKIKPI
jgi:hypothetical protein